LNTGSSCHVNVMGSLIVLVNKRADWHVPVSYIKYMSLCSALWFQH
jgi:Na+-translocating ferredoxin:NAD+ oxidoreductase RnfD subunit